MAASIKSDADGAAKTARKSRDAAIEGLGKEVARQRKTKQLKVSELARMVGVSPSLISQIERGHSQPSVSTLFALSKALEVPVDVFFAADGGAVAEREIHAAATPQEARRTWSAPAGGPAVQSLVDENGRYLVRRESRDTINIEGGVRWERLIPQMNPAVDFVEIVYAPGAESHNDLFQHPGSEMMLVLAGTFEITVGFETYELSEGDSIHFPSTIPHRYVYPSEDEEARAVTVNMRS